MKLYTVGHSTRALDEFITLLGAHDIHALVDVRRFAGSRRYPHFNRDALAVSLARAGIDYHGMATLGGRRAPRPDSRNTAWRNRSFQGYADYMEGDEFRGAIEQLLNIARERATAIMCAEAVWWQCHRALIADYLAVRGVEVCHIVSTTRADPHRYTSPARIVDGRLSYAEAQLQLGSS